MIEFNATLSRKVEYYTGLIFEIRTKDENKNEPIAIGGRYDKIFEELGSAEPIPAVGCSIYVDRLLFDEGDNAVSYTHRRCRRRPLCRSRWSPYH